MYEDDSFVGYSVFQRCVLPPPPRRCISLITDALRPSETFVYFKETTRVYTVDSCNLHTSNHENMKFHISRFVFSVVTAFRRKCCLYPQGSCMFLRNVCTHLQYKSTRRYKAVSLQATKALGWRRGVAPTHSRYRH
jgi:hypothetical protein